MEFTNEQADSNSTEVKAECWGDDHRVEVKFNASAYFAQATIENIVALEESDWSMDYPADAVAKFFEDINPEVEAMFEYNRTAGIGFECTVDRDSALNWLQQNRPDLLEGESRLKAIIEA